MRLEYDDPSEKFYIPFSKRKNRALSLHKKQKEAIRLDRRLKKNTETIHNQGYQKLPRPEFHGWIRYFVLRDDIQRSDEAGQMARVLDAVNRSFVSKNKKFLRYDRKKKKNKDLSPVLKTYSPREFEGLFTDGRLLPEDRKHFHLTVCSRFRHFGLKPEYRYAVKHPWKFVFRTERHYLTEKKILDPVLEAEQSWLKTRLWRRDMLYRRFMEGYAKWDKWWTFKSKKQWKKIRLSIRKKLKRIR